MKKFYFLSIPAFSLILFFCSLAIGLNIASKKPLWHDEVLSQSISVEKRSYTEILFGDYPHYQKTIFSKIYQKWIHQGSAVIGDINEANRCPLFYLLQKIICQFLGYVFPHSYDIMSYRTFDGAFDGTFLISDFKAQIILRIQPILCISLTSALLFYFLSKHYSIWVGIYACGLLASSNLLWRYLVEGRFYALWILLTTLQCLFFLKIINSKTISPSLILKVSIIHILLALTVIASIFQILIVALLLYFHKSRSLLHFLKLTIIPIVLCLGYYFLEPCYYVYGNNPMIYLIFRNFEPDLILINVLCASVILYQYYFDMNSINYRSNEMFPLIQVSLLMPLFTLSAGIILFSLLSRPSSPQSGGIYSRYFIFLLTPGIITTTVLINYIINCLKTKKAHYCALCFFILHFFYRIVIALGVR